MGHTVSPPKRDIHRKKEKWANRWTDRQKESQ